jgi:hypothetical protein
MRLWRRLPAGLVAVVVAVTLAGCAESSAGGRETTTPARASASTDGLHVKGSRLLDGHDRVVRLQGVNRSGSEYACIQAGGIFDGPSDARSVAAIAAWHVNVVRIPLNEDCWLGINGVAPQFSGGAYREAIKSFVVLLHQHGIYAELSLMWGAPGTYKATYQSGAPDADHSPTMWASMAGAFRSDHNVILAPWGETVVDANCFLHGGVCQATYGPSNEPYATAGMQRAVDVMRRAGYTGVIAIPGINYANDLTQWLSHKPHDSLGQLMAEAHAYGNNTCSRPSCFDAGYRPVAKKVPLILGETGETHDNSSCGSANIARIMGWADSHGVGYAAWTWDTWGTCGSLISDYDGTPANPYGTWVKAHYISRSRGG